MQGRSDVCHPIVYNLEDPCNKTKTNNNDQFKHNLRSLISVCQWSFQSSVTHPGFVNRQLNHIEIIELSADSQKPDEGRWVEEDVRKFDTVTFFFVS